ncbi:hypothetical protein WJX72_010629 [[Myrmecia] bisecta]|uniref:Uncharacterized protein n=1 Tax=[Myrmecia] bisecta TaxID=41462 RepID=A0AAW1R9Z2_9CHLO
MANDLEQSGETAEQPLIHQPQMAGSTRYADATPGRRQSRPILHAALGFVIYSIFDFTSTYMYHGWTLKVALLDTLWGTTVFAATGAILDALPNWP